MKVLRYSIRTQKSESQRYGSGGYNRTLQITELFTNNNIEIIDWDQAFVKLPKWKMLLKAICFILKYRFKTRFNLKILFSIGYNLILIDDWIKRHPDAKVFIQEEAPFFLYYYVAREKGLKIISLPHNLESLMPGYDHDYYLGKGLPDSLENELKHLRLSNAIFTISREEQWLIQLMVGSCSFFPYYPPQYIEQQMLSIRQMRNSFRLNKRKHFLILSTKYNPPTLVSTYEQLDWLNIILSRNEFRVSLVGYGLEDVFNQKDYDPAFIEIKGTTTPEELIQLLASVDAVLIHQTTGVGALTKIPELLIAGVPIIAHVHACRSTWSYSGVHSYENIEELENLLFRFNLETPVMVQKPLLAEQKLINLIASMTTTI